jgi:hypothetical protein
VTLKYYVVYSFKKVSGDTGTGRNTVNCERPIDSMDRIEGVEAVLRAGQPDISSLFLLSWIRLES